MFFFFFLFFFFFPPSSSFSSLMSNEIWRRLEGKNEFLMIHSLDTFIRKTHAKTSTLIFVFFLIFEKFFFSRQTWRLSCVRRLNCIFAPGSCPERQMNRVAMATQLFPSVHLCWVISKECQRLAWLARRAAVQCWVVSVVLRSTELCQRNPLRSLSLYRGHPPKLMQTDKQIPIQLVTTWWPLRLWVNTEADCDS